MRERFELLGELRKGGMGVIHRAFDRQRQMPAAVKQVRVADKQLIQSIRREVHALLRIRHPGVVTMLAEGVDDGMPWYAMEFVEAQTLLEYCHSHTAPRIAESVALSDSSMTAHSAGTMPSGNPAESDVTGVISGLALPPRAANAPPNGPPTATISTLRSDDLATLLTVIRRICIPLSYIHGEGLVHLDLKPENLLIRRSGMPVILDFGLATVVRSSLGRDGLFQEMLGAGTAFYMAPEQIRGGLVDARTDIYALGCILYQLLIGRPPFFGTSVAETIFGHLNIKPIPPMRLISGIPLALNDLILKMLEKDPRARLGYAQDVDQALKELGASGWDGGTYPEARTYVYRPRIAGRAQELGSLLQAFKSAQKTQTQLVLLEGESGIGKTRLVAEFARLAPNEVKHAEVYLGECRPQGGLFSGFAGILQTIADICREKPQKERQRLLGRRAAILSRYEPEFQWFLEDAEPLPELLPEAAQQLLFQDLLGVLQALGQTRPSVIILDDIQWIDELSLGFLKYMLAQKAAAPIGGIIVATYRSGEPSPAVAELAAQKDTLAIRLGRLSAEAVGTLISDMLALPRIASEVVESLFSHSEGNPLFLTEYLMEAVAKSLIWRDPEGIWHTRGGAEKEIDYARLALPATVQDLIVHRLADLSPEAKRLAELGAVLGTEPNFEVLALAAAMSDAVFFAALDELRRRHVLSAKAAQRLEFGHSKIREATYFQMSAQTRAHLHFQIGKTLAALPEDHPARLAADIAEHYYAAGNEAAALPYALSAGDDARSLYAHDAAERFYRRAIATLKGMSDGELTTRTLMKLGLVYMAAFQPEKARSIYEEAFQHWDALGSNFTRQKRMAELAVATGEPLSLDPGRTYDTDSAFVQRQLFSGLVEVDEEANVLPAIAMRWQISSDGKLYTFFLRQDARFSDGTPLCAKHFEYAWKRNLSPELGAPAAAMLDVLENAQAYRHGRALVKDVGVVAKGLYELEVRLAAPVGYLLQLLAHPIAAPLPSWLVEAQGKAWATSEKIVTNGAFKVVSWVPGLELKLEHNVFDSVWSSGNVRTLRCKIFHDYRDALKAYKDGQVDLLDMVSADAQLVAALREEHGDELISVPVQSTSYLVFRTDRPPFCDVNVRRAFAHAINRQRLAEAAQKIGAQPATGGFVPPGVPGHSPQLVLGYVPEEARSQLAQSGQSPQAFQGVKWLHTHGVADPAILNVLRESWRCNLGIELTPKVLRWREYEQQIAAGMPDILITTWTADFFDPDNFLRTVFHSSTGLNEPRWQNREFDLLVDSAAGRRDQSGRMNFYRAADKILIVDEAAIVPLCYGREPVLAKPWIEYFPRTASWLRHLKNCRVDRATQFPTAKA